ncbi:uncharacterized protein MELLADRAFT_114733 [Melampsora larici-populina 98AG31]|uniref:Uncharacterized protein n=1 Tax=Melampsora larici-populina (strain 98AG31 / pathotype 3-4-7) TaxID=747676 RepID=F4SEJ9_MELLP|nr:uncharacterized protein MELLADRAFT_114733 [Melampsora larici-populina 98AG31]EGF96927.1 hypothetical protein MELLADRAFT_114733 [Melampsora larici-populina 98AG31]
MNEEIKEIERRRQINRNHRSNNEIKIEISQFTPSTNLTRMNSTDHQPLQPSTTITRRRRSNLQPPPISSTIKTANTTTTTTTTTPTPSRGTVGVGVGPGPVRIEEIKRNRIKRLKSSTGLGLGLPLPLPIKLNNSSGLHQNPTYCNSYYLQSGSSSTNPPLNQISHHNQSI